jgi:diacylglycerol kinase family enzyme
VSSKALYLFNPAAGGRRRQRVLADLVETLGKVALIETTSREDVVERTRAALLDGTELVVAIGGDGTVNAAVQGYFAAGRPLRPAARLAVVDCGTGSDYARSLGSGRSWRERLTAPQALPVDVGTAVTDSGAEHFVNMISFGVSAMAVAGKNRAAAWQPAFLRYLLPTVGAAIQGKPQTVRVDMDGRVVEAPLLALLVAKGRYAGGGMRVGQGALDDGELTVTLVGPLAPLTVLSHLHRIYDGRLGAVPGIEQVRARRVQITTPTPWPYEMDGEVRPPTRSAAVSLLPRSLVVLA